jgi:pSer/pThr/pTyr-binding forkhead associated (FHA) protein
MVLVRPIREPREIALKPGKLVLGRQTGCQIRIPVDTVSRQHAELSFDGSRLVIKDLKSRNGVLVNHKRVAEAVLVAGDVIVVGPAVFVVKVDGKPVDVLAVAAAAEAHHGDSAEHDTSTRMSPPTKAAPARAAKPFSDPDDSSVVEFDFLSEDDDDQPKL